MFWLVVEGGGSWSDGKLYRSPGPHPISAITAARAKATGYTWLTVYETDEPPVVDDEQPSGTLTSADFGKTEVPLEYEEPEGPEIEEKIASHTVDASTGRIPCPVGCGRDYASDASLQRHLDTAHGGQAG